MTAAASLSEGETLRAALGQTTPERIALLSGPRMRDFVTGLRESFRPGPLA
jgi:hypothetical protein